MNIDENLTLLHLKSNGYTDIIHEPDGNIPPDFVIDGKIAIEVRRLNKYIINNQSIENIEKLSAVLYNTITGILGTFITNDYYSSCIVFYKFKRPLLIDKILKKKIIAACNEQLLILSQYNEYEIDENLHIRFAPVDRKLESVFRFGGRVDFDSGGFIVSEICKNIGSIIIEKEIKVTPHKGKYETWWLALVDHIGWGISEHERNEIRKHIFPGKIFDKILIINPVSPEKGIFLYEA